MKNIRRNPDVVWREEEDAREEVIGAMERGEDASCEGTVLLIVSGMMHQLNILGAEIWKLLDGRDESAVVDEIAKAFEMDRPTIESDVHNFLTDLADRGWILYEQ
ncbi:MAG TPA: GeoRSP system PqqD family peptide chaperone [Nitrospirota bacterium]|jgi:pyrroloquinoline quinone biosynthesis protein D